MAPGKLRKGAHAGPGPDAEGERGEGAWAPKGAPSGAQAVAGRSGPAESAGQRQQLRHGQSRRARTGTRSAETAEEAEAKIVRLMTDEPRTRKRPSHRGVRHPVLRNTGSLSEPRESRSSGIRQASRPPLRGGDPRDGDPRRSRRGDRAEPPFGPPPRCRHSDLAPRRKHHLRPPRASPSAVESITFVRRKRPRHGEEKGPPAGPSTRAGRISQRSIFSGALRRGGCAPLRCAPRSSRGRPPLEDRFCAEIRQSGAVRPPDGEGGARSGAGRLAFAGGAAGRREWSRRSRGEGLSF